MVCVCQSDTVPGPVLEDDGVDGGQFVDVVPAPVVPHATPGAVVVDNAVNHISDAVAVDDDDGNLFDVSFS